MKEELRSHLGTGRAAIQRLALCALLILFAVPSTPAIAQGVDHFPACRLQGSWLAEVNIGGQFFTQYATGASATSGPLTIEWIQFDPTLFDNFPTVVRVTEAMGAWSMHAQSYDYTWRAYGIDVAGNPVYALRGSGTGSFQDCNTVDFDWVLEVEFLTPGGPVLVDCLSGTGTKERIQIVQVTCP